MQRGVHARKPHLVHSSATRDYINCVIFQPASCPGTRLASSHCLNDFHFKSIQIYAIRLRTWMFNPAARGQPLSTAATRCTLVYHPGNSTAMFSTSKSDFKQWAIWMQIPQREPVLPTIRNISESSGMFLLFSGIISMSMSSNFLKENFFFWRQSIDSQ